LEGSITTLPLTLMLLIIFYCFYRDDVIFLYACISGIFLDMMLVRHIGASSIFFLVILFLIFLYQKKFEIASYYFVFFALFIGTIGYLFFFSLTDNFFVSISTVLLGMTLYWFLKKFGKRSI
jgi:hypothetical protein